MILNLIGSQNCRIFAKDVAYHAWPNLTMKRGVTCVCGAIRVKRIRRDGEIVSENVPQPAVSNARSLSADEEIAALDGFRPI